jgi:TRAP-type C4-dicarboxylate transport system substrate-binding protein
LQSKGMYCWQRSARLFVLALPTTGTATLSGPNGLIAFRADTGSGFQPRMGCCPRVAVGERMQSCESPGLRQGLALRRAVARRTFTRMRRHGRRRGPATPAPLPLVALRLLLLPVIVAGCSFGGNSGKAGGEAQKQVIVLAMGSQISDGQPEQLQRFASEVERRSGGTMRIEFKANWRGGDLHQEVDTIADVKAGKLDLAWVGARAWDWVGVHSFDALVAPLLIDSHALEQRVFERRIPQRMLPDVAGDGIVAIGVLPGPLRTLIGLRNPLVKPADLSGKRIGVQGAVAAETLRALGANPRQYFAHPPLAGLDGMEEQLGAVVGNEHDKVARYLSANLDLWPRPLVIFAGQRTFRSLTRKQQAVLAGAATAAVPEAMATSKREDADAARALCARRRLAFVDVTPAQVEDLRRALAPVYVRLERDAETRRAIREILALKRTIAPDGRIACARRATAPRPRSPTPLDGVWVMKVDRSDLVGNDAYKAWGAYRGVPFSPTEEDYRLDAGSYRLALRDGHAQNSAVGARQNAKETKETGFFKVKNGMVVFKWSNGNDVGETWAYHWSIFRGALTFSPPPPGHRIGPPNMMFASWRRASK